MARTKKTRRRRRTRSLAGLGLAPSRHEKEALQLFGSSMRYVKAARSALLKRDCNAAFQALLNGRGAAGASVANERGAGYQTRGAPARLDAGTMAFASVEKAFKHACIVKR